MRGEPVGRGGPAALKGFYEQALVALLRAAAEPGTWTRFVVEPRGERDCADIRWDDSKMTQVKYRTGDLRPSEVRGWAEQIARDAASFPKRELLLIGHASRRARQVAVKGVHIEFLGPEVATQATQVLGVYFVGAGRQYTVPEVVAIRDHLHDRIFCSSVQGAEWSRGDLLREADCALQAVRPQPVSQDALDVQVTRTIVIDAFQRVHDLFLYEVTGRGRADLYNVDVIPTWTDSDVTVEHVYPRERVVAGNTNFALQVKFRVPELSTGESWPCAVAVRRSGLVQPNRDGSETYSDPILPHNAAWPCHLTVVCLRSAGWVMVGPFTQLDDQVLEQRATLPLEQRPIVLTWKTDTHTTPTRRAREVTESALEAAGHPGLASNWLS